jgi:hypothetical protein
MSQPTCKTCRFLEKPDPYNSTGYCRRYPEFMEMYDASWCGEHKPKSRVTENLT